VPVSKPTTAESLTGRHIEAVRRYARENRKKTLLLACERASRRGPGDNWNVGAMRTVANAYDRLHAGGFLGPWHPSPTSDDATSDDDPDSVEAGESDELIERAHHAHRIRGAASASGSPGLRAPGVPPSKLDLDAIDHLAALCLEDGAVTRGLIRRIRGLEAKMRATGESLANFVGEDADEGRELAELSRELIAVADAGADA
jgi:hypothetical protein